MQQNSSILAKDKNVSKNVGPYKDKESTLKEKNIKEDHRKLADKSLDIRSHIRDVLSGRISQAELLENELSSFLREVKFSDQKFAASILVSNIKYNHPKFQNNNSFYQFFDQFDYRLAKYFAEFKTTQSNIDKFLIAPFMALLTKKLSY